MTTKKVVEKEIDLHAEEDKTTYSGTFRWKSTKKLLSLPPLINRLEVAYTIDTISEIIALNQGWKGYFLSRGQLSSHFDHDKNKKLIEVALDDLSFVDCLSFPLSIVYLLIEKNLLNLNLSEPVVYQELNIICIGCSYKTEERILRETNCFQELKYLLLGFFQQINFYFVGPEISETKLDFIVIPATFRHRESNPSGKEEEEDEDNTTDGESSTIIMNHSLHFHLFKGTTSDFIRTNPNIVREVNHTIVVGYNCGFGNFDNNYQEKSHLSKTKRELLKFRLLFDWIYDLSLLTQLLQKAAFFMFVANEYADLTGEVQILINIFGMNAISLPGENPFSMASTMVAEVPGKGSSTSSNDYARGNSYYYAVQGIDSGRRVKLTNLKDFHTFRQNSLVAATQQENPYEIPLLKELLPYLQNIPHFSQASRFLGRGKLELTKVPFDKPLPSPTKPIAAPPAPTNISVSNQPPVPPESKKQEENSTLFDEMPSLVKEVESTVLIPKVDESLAEKPSAQEATIVSPDIKQKSESYFDMDQQELMHVTQQLNPKGEKNEIIIDLVSSRINMKSIDLHLNTSGKDLLLRYQLLSSEDSGNYKEQSIPLVTEIPLPIENASIKAKLFNKKKLLNISISF